MGRTPCCNEEGLKKGAWTADEDQKLIAYIQQHGEGGWRTLPQKAGLQRCGKSCRLRWANYLRPDIKRGQFSTEEEQKIIQLHSTLGNRWSAIARHLPKRTDNEIKNYWNTHIKKRLVEMGIDPVTRTQIGPSPSSSNDNSTNVNVTEDSTQNVDSEIRPIERSISASAKLLNKVSAKFALMQRQGMASAPSHSLDAFKAVLINSTTDSGLSRGGGGGNGSGGNDSDIEMLVSTSVPLKKRFPSQILNKMASKLAASKSFDMLKNRLGDAANSTNVNVACNSNSSTGRSYNNIESPNISISDFFEKTTSSTCESSELNENLFYIEEDEINEAFAMLHHAVGLESNPSSPMCEYVGNCGAEDGAIFTDSMKENMADDFQVGINMEFNNFENSTNFIERFTNMPFGGSPIEYTSTNYYSGEGESHGENPQENLNYWTQDFDLLNYAIQ